MGRTVLITGCSGGIGESACEIFHEAGWVVYGFDLKSPREESIVNKIVKKVFIGSLENEEDIVKCMDEISKANDGKLNALVNNAAVQICKPLIELTVEDWDLTMRVNLRGPFLTTKHAHPLLLKAAQETNLPENTSAIVNVSSIHNFASSRNIASYATSKGGLSALTRNSALEFASQGIRVNAVCPAAVDTPMLRDGLKRGHLDPNASEENLVQQLGLLHPIKRCAKPSDIAQFIEFLCDSKKSSFMTGQSHLIDGGAMAILSTEK